MKYKFYLCNMKIPTSPYEFLASFFLLEGMLDWFELTSVTEESIDESSERVLSPFSIFIWMNVITVPMRHLICAPTDLSFFMYILSKIFG